MSNSLRINLYKAALAAGILVLIGLVAANIWLWQSDDGSGQTAGSGQGAQDDFQAPGLPGQNASESGGGTSSGDSGPRHYELNVGDSVGLDDSQGGPAPREVELNVSDSVGLQDSGGSPGLNTGSAAAVLESFRLETTGSNPKTTVSDSASVGDSVVTQVQPEQPLPSGGGASDSAEVEDSVTLVIRDKDGNGK